jgi:hypothetical protein
MASTRPIKLDKWGISWEEYKELTYFCLQYEQKKREAAALLTLRISTPPPITYHKKVGDDSIELGEFMPHGGNHTSDPVAATAAKRERLLCDVRLIEQAAYVAGKLEGGYNIYASILQAVTTRSGVQAVMADPDKRPPCGKNEFYAARRKFFWILRELKNGDAQAS